MFDTIVLSFDNTTMLVYLVIAMTYAIAGVIYFRDSHGGLCACYATSSFLHTILGFYNWHY